MEATEHATEQTETIDDLSRRCRRSVYPALRRDYGQVHCGSPGCGGLIGFATDRAHDVILWCDRCRSWSRLDRPIDAAGRVENSRNAMT